MELFFLIFLGFNLTALVLFLGDRYLYSWVGWVLNKIGFCEYKTLSVRGNNGYPRSLSFRLDLRRIAREIGKNENYKVTGNYDADRVTVSRIFPAYRTGKTKTVSYEITFENQGETFGAFNLKTLVAPAKNPMLIIDKRIDKNGISEVSVYLSEDSGLEDFGGENCTAPDRILRKNVFLMIDDLPLTDIQKDEIKRHVHVVCCGGMLKSIF